MNSLLPLWRTLSWIGERRRKLSSEEWKGSLRWQDKASGLAGWTVVLTCCLHIVFCRFCGVRQHTRLAPLPDYQMFSIRYVSALGIGV